MSRPEPKFGCSECLCIAIESHRAALLMSLLQRSNVMYRDMFWAPTPTTWEWTNDDRLISGRIATWYPKLHSLNEHFDLSIVGRADCGHMRAVVDLRIPLSFTSNAYILVSLPMIARWNSTKRFNAERILRQSGKFHYSEPQIFHLNKYERDLYISVEPLCGPLKLDETRLFCEFEYMSSCKSARWLVNQAIGPLVFRRPLTGPSEMVFVACEFTESNSYFNKYYGTLSHLFHQIRQFESYDLGYAYICSRLAKTIRVGTNLNSLLLACAVQQ